MQTLAFFLGLVFSATYLVVRINVLIDSFESIDIKNPQGFENGMFVILFAAILSWTWLFYLTH